ncbi:Isochorismatase-like protein [Talaromyces proteolyticus]|uniref:Isochorismatase-like protein n=1 Tax=Talaromyces proteolyticus TaxID=1131652 RepID=A0AAD4KQN3_9EURO|nr:Isochorismatase-like protein [Talaromyces proteolyticus]KAH8697205.1 Isochorismatase-like protein [Talaromyces proteolyticus]
MASSNSVDETSPSYYNPSQTALLLLDFHVLFVQKAGGPKASAALQNAIKLKSWAQYQGIRVIHCLIDRHKTTFPTAKGANRLSGFLSAMQASGGEEAPELIDQSSDDKTFTRTPGHVSALKSPGLEAYLQKNGIKSLIITGLSTSGCVLKTALAAADAEFVVSVISDGCADGDEELHDVLVRKVLNHRGYVYTTAEFLQEYASRK